VGGGINGAGIARDAAGRGLSVVLLEKDDLASHTSSWSTKLIHGGLRYLEHYEFRLVAESLAEREVLLRIAPHIIGPLQFVLPHEPHLRPAWMIRAGLFLYDRLGGRKSLPSSFSVKLRNSPWGAGLKPSFSRGFVYSDARVDDARLVVLNAIDARERGAEIRTRTRVVGARRNEGLWRISVWSAAGDKSEIRARALVNAGGPWVKDVLESVSAAPVAERVRHVKGSHIVVPRLYDAPHAYILQNADQRIVFIIPYLDRYSLIGTTDVAVDDYQDPQASPDEVAYLCEIASTYLAKPISAADVVWTYSGVRPLYDDGSSDPSKVTRDYVLKLDGAAGEPPLLSVFGGKITTYRRLAEHALAELVPAFPAMRGNWTEKPCLPGGDIGRGTLEDYREGLVKRYPALPAEALAGLVHRHGSRALKVLGAAETTADLGFNFGAGLYQVEVEYLVRAEWALTAEDVLWRRTKCGLTMSEAERERVAHFLSRRRVAAHA